MAGNATMLPKLAIQYNAKRSQVVFNLALLQAYFTSYKDLKLIDRFISAYDDLKTRTQITFEICKQNSPYFICEAQTPLHASTPPSVQT